MVVVALGVLFVVAGVCLYQSPPDADQQWVWTIWMIAAGVFALTFAWRFDSAAWWQISRIFAVVGVMSRSGAIITRWAHGTLDPWLSVAGLALFAIGTITIYQFWSSTLRYWSGRVALTEEHRQPRRRGR